MTSDIVWAAKNGDIKKMEQFFSKDRKVVSMEVEGRLLIHYAADYGQAQIIDFLASKGADVNTPDKYGITPLLSAIYENHPDCVKVLLAKGAKKTGKSPDGKTYRDCAESDEVKQLL